MFLYRKPQNFNSKFAEFKPIIEENRALIKKGNIDEVILRHFESTQGYRFDLNDPNSFNEKLAARKKQNNPLFAKCADKLAVRDYVKERIGEEHLIPIYYSGRHLTRKAWDKLPQQFVAKTNNGSGTVDIIRQKDQIKYEDLYNELEDWLSVHFGYIDGEMWYEKIPPRVLIEALITDENGDVPKDYKIHCFKNGGDKKKILQIDYDRFSNHTRGVYDEAFKKLDVEIGFKKNEYDDEKPENFNELLSVADELSKDFDYVRVDLYDLNGKIYFGELTFCHGGGGEIITPREYDTFLGSYW